MKLDKKRTFLVGLAFMSICAFWQVYDGIIPTVDAEIAGEVDAEYADKDLLLVGVLNGAVMVMADLSRHLASHVHMDWMAISSYGSGTQSSGVVRILKDLNTDIEGRHVLVVEDIIDTGLTLAYLMQNLQSRKPASLEIMTMFR